MRAALVLVCVTSFVLASPNFLWIGEGESDAWDDEPNWDETGLPIHGYPQDGDNAEIENAQQTWTVELIEFGNGESLNSLNIDGSVDFSEAGEEPVTLRVGTITIGGGGIVKVTVQNAGIMTVPS